VKPREGIQQRARAHAEGFYGYVEQLEAGTSFAEGALAGYEIAIEELRRLGEMGLVCARTLEERLGDGEE